MCDIPGTRCRHGLVSASWKKVHCAPNPQQGRKPRHQITTSRLNRQTIRASNPVIKNLTLSSPAPCMRAPPCSYYDDRRNDMPSLLGQQDVTGNTQEMDMSGQQGTKQDGVLNEAPGRKLRRAANRADQQEGGATARSRVLDQTAERPRLQAQVHEIREQSTRQTLQNTEAHAHRDHHTTPSISAHFADRKKKHSRTPPHHHQSAVSGTKSGSGSERGLHTQTCRWRRRRNR